MPTASLPALLRRIDACKVCVDLPHEPRPIVQVHREARILVIGQAPGRRVHESGIPWDDPSGKRLRGWLGVSDDAFYDPRRFALMPMGFCYPGTGKGGDLPPRSECAPLWHDELLHHLPKIELTLLLSRFAQDAYLGSGAGKTLTESVQNWKTFRPRVLPLPHPSPRNARWFAKHAWFDDEVVPYLQRRVRKLLRD